MTCGSLLSSTPGNLITLRTRDRLFASFEDFSFKVLITYQPFVSPDFRFTADSPGQHINQHVVKLRYPTILAAAAGHRQIVEMRVADKEIVLERFIWHTPLAFGGPPYITSSSE